MSINQKKIDRLIEEDDPDLQEILLDTLRHSRQDIRIYAAVKLAQHFQDIKAVPVLAEAMYAGNWSARKMAASALWEVGDANPAGLLRALHFESDAVRQAIAEGLELAGWIPDDVDSEVTYRIMTWNWQQIAVIGSPAVPALLSVLSDPDGNVRRGAAWTLGKIGDARAVPWLIECLNDTAGGLMGIGERVCDIAAEALVRIGTPEAVAAVEQWQAGRDNF